jgi:BirA family biotin operon repressor/biotin-[acetyl-CoA-carboxylase] ligase
MIVSERVRSVLAARTRFRTIYEWSKVDSTNRWLLAAAAHGAPDGAVAVADMQTAGRGRLQRTWEAPAGSGLLLSVLLRSPDLPADRRHLLTAAMGLAAQAAFEGAGGFRPDLKWPNDLEVNGAKLAGVLAQASGPAVVVGIGCNVSWAPAGATSAIECAGHPVERAALAEGLLLALEELLSRPLGDLAGAYRGACATVGREVRVQQVDGVLEGWAEGLDDDGRLLVRPRVGTRLVAVAVGDVVHLRPATGEGGV